MTPTAILQLLSGLLSAAPEVLSLFNRATSGQTVTSQDVSAILSQYGIARAVLVAAIASAEAAAKPAAAVAHDAPAKAP